jgi:hypothetical protein
VAAGQEHARVHVPLDSKDGAGLPTQQSGSRVPVRDQSTRLACDESRRIQVRLIRNLGANPSPRRRGNMRRGNRNPELLLNL